LRLLRIGPNGDASEIEIGDFSSGWSSYDCDWQGSGAQYSATATVPTLITNADQGVLASYSVTTSTSSSAATLTYYLATTSGTGVSIAPMSISDQQAPVQPVLQRADGSYIGTVSTSTANPMIAFTSSGNTLWMGPNDTPQIATADGGVIGASGTTYDPNGNVTGQIASLPTYSWKGAYTDGDVASLAIPLPPIDTTFAAFIGGNLTGNGTSTELKTIGLYWCGTGYGEVGSCSEVGAPDVQWKYLQEVNSENFGKAVDFSVAQPNSPAHTDWVDQIEADALYALQQAFWNIPVNVRRSTPRKGSAWECISSLQQPGCSIIDEDTDRVYVSGVWPGGGPTGLTTGIPPLTPIHSEVYYWISLMNSESFLKLNPPFPPRTNTDNSAFVQLLQGIGRGIGNAAAHELGHHFEYTFTINMDCPTKYDLPCAGNNGVVFERDGGYFEEYRYTYPNIQWQPNSVCAIEQYYNGEQWRNPKIGCTVDYFKKHF
jgi:hypothetical protein